MKSAFGNFNAGGVRVDYSGVSDGKHVSYDINTGNIIAQEDIAKGDVVSFGSVPIADAPVVDEASVDFNKPVVSVLDYVAKDDWDHFEGLVMLMLANGASLYELQQRIMGFSE